MKTEVIRGILFFLLGAILGSVVDIQPAPRSTWYGTYLRECQARSIPCLRTTGTPCPRPTPLTPAYCPFP